MLRRWPTCEGTPEPAGLFLSGLWSAATTVHDNGAGIYFRGQRNSAVMQYTYRNTDTSMGAKAEALS